MCAKGGKLMERKNIGKDFLDLITDAKKNPEKYQIIKNCKDLSDVYSAIKKIHPEYTFTEEELGKFILSLAKIPDNELNISGGIKATDSDIKSLESHLGTAGYLTKFGSKFINFFSDIIFSEKEMNPVELINMVQNTKSGENFQSDNMCSVGDNLETVKEVDKIPSSNLLELSKANQNSLKKLSKSKNMLDGSFAEYASKYRPNE